MSPFVFNANPARIVFGIGTLAHLERELDLLGSRRSLLICTPGVAQRVEPVIAALGSRIVDTIGEAVMHVPIESVREACKIAANVRADSLIAIGGGSTTGLAKAITLQSNLPIVAIPTTYAGSEMTPIFGITEGGLKRTGKDSRVLPRTVIYDVDLSLSLPSVLTLTSGMNAIAHAAEGLYAQDGNPMMSLVAEEGIRALSHALPLLGRDPRNAQARGDALYGAWLCGTVLGNVGMALHHKLCHTLGGSFNLPHAEVHTVMLPHALAFNATFAPDAMLRLRRAMNTDDPTGLLFDIGHQPGVPRSLRELGLPLNELDRAADIAAANPYWNPRPIERDAIRGLLQEAWEGTRPTTPKQG